MHAPDDGFNVRLFEVSDLPYTVAMRITQRDEPLVIYIEGDGRAYITPSLPSSNPTPKNPVGWQLARLDAAANVVYLGRPCQYGQTQACKDNKWWTTHRFDPRIVRDYSHLIDQLKTTENQRIELIGYSGGAALAMALATRRQDVASIRTVAGNLSPHMVNRYHRVSAQPNAVSPLNHAELLKEIPQIHFTGRNDYIIPPYLTEQFMANLSSSCVHIRTLNANHHTGWQKAWPELLRYKAEC